MPSRNNPPSTCTAVSEATSALLPEGASGWRSWWAEPWDLKLVDIGLAAILIGSPFLMGGRQAMGQLVLCILSTLTALLWSISGGRRGNTRWSFTGAEPIMLLGLGLVVLQCCRLSPDLLNAISPHVRTFLPQWDGTSPLLPEIWGRISFTPSDTWSNFVVLVACLLFFFVAVQRLKTVDDLSRFLCIVAWGGGAMALFGLIQFSWSNGRFFWVYAHPMTTTDFVAKGAFTNANHFANYLAMTIPAQLLMIVRRLAHPGKTQSPPRTAAEDVDVQSSVPQGPENVSDVVRPRSWRTGWGMFHNQSDAALLGWSVLLAVTAVAILCSNSHNGIFSASMGLLLALVIFWKKTMLSTRQSAVIAGVLLIWLLMIPFLRTPSAGGPNFRLTKSDLKKLTTREGRQAIWDANMDGLREFPLAGTGLGSHHEVYWLWFDSPQDGREYSHAENGYLQLAMETGLTGLGVVILLWLTTLLWCVQGLWNAKTPRVSGIMAVVTAGLCISLIHSITDFVWYVPACVNLVLLYAICAWRISLMRFYELRPSVARSSHSFFHSPRISWICAFPCIALLGFWMIREKLPEVAAEPLWDEYLRLSLHAPLMPPSDDDKQENRQRRSELAIAAARANPRAQRLQLHAGLACLNQFALEQSQQQHHMPLTQIRDAARSLFTSRAEMDEWLNRPGVLGAQRQQLEEAIDHFQASLAACPLQPRPYLELAELAWLRVDDSAIERRLVEQAVAARPCDARAQFALGRLLWLNGEQKEAAAHWQFAFRHDEGYRLHLIDALAAYVPARFFLDHFEPDHESLKQLRRAYALSEDHAGYELLVGNLARSCVKVAMSEEGDVAEAEWRLGHECFVELGDRNGAYHCAREAVESNPESYDAHQLLGLWLYRNGRFSEAVEVLAWCRKQKPEEVWLSAIETDARSKLRQRKPATKFADRPSQRVIR